MLKCGVEQHHFLVRLQCGNLSFVHFCSNWCLTDPLSSCYLLQLYQWQLLGVQTALTNHQEWLYIDAGQGEIHPLLSNQVQVVLFSLIKQAQVPHKIFLHCGINVLHFSWSKKCSLETSSWPPSTRETHFHFFGNSQGAHHLAKYL